MPSGPVIEALDKLHQELSQLEPAIRHIEAAQQIAKEVKVIPKLQTEFLDKLAHSNSVYKEKLVSDFKAGIDRINDEHKNIAASTGDLVKSVKLKTEEIALYIETLRAFHEKVEQIDFPERLDMIESTVKKTVSEIEKTGKATVLELGVLVRQIENVDFIGDFEKLKNIVSASAKSNANFAEVLQKQDISKRISEVKDKVESIQKKDLPKKIDEVKIIVDDLIFKVLECRGKISALDENIRANQDENIRVNQASSNNIIEQLNKSLLLYTAQTKANYNRYIIIVILLIVVIIGTFFNFFIKL